MTAADQIRFFRTSFGKRPSPNEVGMFELELRRANLDVMAEALRQAEAAAKRVNRPPVDIRSAVLMQYDRIVALNGQLFPVFFVFESAYRTLLGNILDFHYAAEDWWHPVRDAIDRGQDETHVTLLSGISVPREVMRAIGQILRMQRRGAAEIGSTHDLMRVSTLFDMGVLLDRHYSVVSSLMDPSVVGGVPTRAEFGALFTRVRQARNDAYHQLVVRERPRVVSAAERLLDLIDIHLGDRIAKINGVAKPDLSFSVFREARHQ